MKTVGPRSSTQNRFKSFGSRRTAASVTQPHGQILFSRLGPHATGTLSSSVLPSPDSPQWPSSWSPTGDLPIFLEEAYLVENSTLRGLNQCQIAFGCEDSPREWHIELDLYVDSIDDSAGIVTARPIQSGVNSAEAYNQISRWLNQCRKHVDCGGVDPFLSSPSRAIEVAPRESPGTPRLRYTKGHHDLYLALSYCWGSGQPYVLTTKNIEKLMRGLKMTKLPRTISDAVEVTKTLGFKYLWVDALVSCKIPLKPLHEKTWRENLRRRTKFAKVLQ